VIDLAQAKRHLNILASDTSQDAEIQDMIDAATEWVESRVGPVIRRTYTDTVWASGEVLLLGHAPVISLTSIAGAYGYSDTYAVGDVFLDADAGIVRLATRATWTTNPLAVTYVAGRATIPAAIRTAALLILKSLWETQRGAAAVSLQGLEDNAEVPGIGLAVWRAEKLLEPYLLPPVVA